MEKRTDLSYYLQLCVMVNLSFHVLSDADVEDNLESETSRLQIIANDYGSNLSANVNAASHDRCTSNNLSHRNRCDSEGEVSASDLPIKSGTVKENRILPSDISQSGDSQPASLDSIGSGIKEGDNREIEKLANGISNLELDNMGSERTQEACRRPAKAESNHVDYGVRGEGAQSLAMNNCDSRGLSNIPVVGEILQCPQDSVVDSGRREGEAGKDCSLEGGDGATGLEKDMEDKLILTGDTSAAGCGSLPNADKKTAFQNHVVGKSLKEFRLDARYKSKTTLAPRYQPSSKECSVMSCLHQFTAAELLTGSNKVSCKMCTKNRPKNATPHKGTQVALACRMSHSWCVTAVWTEGC